MLELILVSFAFCVLGATFAYGVSLSGGGMSISQSISRTGDHPNTYEIALPVGKAGTLTTRVSDTEGTVTATAHGFIVNDVVMLFWSGGRRYHITVDTVPDANSFTFNNIPASGGDILPAVSTALVATKEVTINTAIDGDAIQILGIVAEVTNPAATPKALIDMQDSGAASIEVIDLTANTPKVYDIVGGAANIFTGNVITVSKAANGSATDAMTLKVMSLEDSTP
jgi:hypothetical protein